ncbi:MAG: ArsR/SmtB family transcription factor [Slackia sp.]
MALLGEEFIACSAMLAALGNECRQAIFLDLLRNWGGLRTCEIAEHVGLSKPAVSRHLGIMEKAGIVTMKRVGTVRIYHPSESTKPWMALSQLAWNDTASSTTRYRQARPESCARAHLGRERTIHGSDAGDR